MRIFIWNDGLQNDKVNTINKVIYLISTFTQLSTLYVLS